MKSEEWKSYRTRFLVNAKQLNSTLSFVDHLGRQHRGRKGDYLVESSDGVISIAPRRIFEDIYVPMPQPQVSEIPELEFQKIGIEQLALRKPSVGRQSINDARMVAPSHTARAQRKLPQPCRDPRSSPNRIGLM
jgi:hypothetical protein